MNQRSRSIWKVANALAWRIHLALAAVGIAIIGGSPVRAQLRVVNYNIAQLMGNQTALQNVFAALHADDKPGFATPVSVFVFQEVKTVNVATLQSLLNNSAPAGVNYTLGTFTSSVLEDGSAGAQAIFFRSGMLQEFPASHIDIPTGANRNADRWRLQLLNYSSIGAWFYVYGAHLRSDTCQQCQDDRLVGVTSIRSNADGLGVNQHIIYCGDFNFYNNAELGYLRFFASGNGQAIDGLGTGSWAGGAGNPNNIKHSQSPRSINAGGLVGGGLDDRFDFQLFTASFQDNAGLAQIPGTYRGLGNDGQHYNMAINQTSNFYYPGDPGRSMALANNLHEASDHIPIVVDYQIPAVMAASIMPNYGRVIQGTAFSVPIAVSNVANVTVPIGADLLHYTAAASQNLSGASAGSMQALAPAATPSFVLNTTITGQRIGQVLVTSTSQAVQNASIVLNTTGTVVRPSNASFSSSADIDQITVATAFDANTGVQPIPINIHNFGFDSLQALLDIDSIGGVMNPFAYNGGAPTGIGAAPATLMFSINTNNLANGRYSMAITINVSDENIPGAIASVLNLTLITTIGSVSPCDADLNGDNVVNVDDLLTVISAWGPCPPVCPADINDDHVVNVDDLLAVISAWGDCP